MLEAVDKTLNQTKLVKNVI